MIWTLTAEETIIGRFKVDEGVKLNSANYCDFTDNSFFEWYKSQSLSFKVKCVLMHANAPSFVCKLTREFERLTGEKITE